MPKHEYTRHDSKWWRSRDPGLATMPNGDRVPITFHPADERWLAGSSTGRSPDPGSVFRPDGWTLRVYHPLSGTGAPWGLELRPPFHHPVMLHTDEQGTDAHGFNQRFGTWEVAMAALKKAAAKRWSELPGGSPAEIRKIIQASEPEYGSSDNAWKLADSYARPLGSGVVPPDMRLPRGMKKGYATMARRKKVERLVWKRGQMELFRPIHLEPGGPLVAEALGLEKFDMPSLSSRTD